MKLCARFQRVDVIAINVQRFQMGKEFHFIV